MEVGLVGSGSWPCALAQVFLDAGHQVTWWVHSPAIAESLRHQRRHPVFFSQHLYHGLKEVTTQKDALASCEVIVVATPAIYLRQTLENMPWLAHKPVFSGIKGIEPSTLAPVSKFLREKGMGQVAIFSGPSHAEEVIQGRLTWLDLASHEATLLSLGKKLFEAPYIMLRTHGHVEALEWMGILKNVYAIGLGAATIWGENARAALAAAFLAEMQTFLQSFSPYVSLPFASTGFMGDFLVTAFSSYSRNQQFGRWLMDGLDARAALDKIGMIPEGYFAAMYLPRILPLAEVPLLRAIIDFVGQKLSPDAFRETLVRMLS
ncbi:MAG: NAD(P)H-dependent glycerol-3-phosphate dehydrogenase [Bacteroidia bacterium]